MLKGFVVLFVVMLGQTMAVPQANLTLVDVFSAGEGGYACIKIPSLVCTGNGTLIALGEARTGSCSDFTQTSLVSKRSFDGGATWGALTVVFAEEGHVIGNAAPVVVPKGASGGEELVMPFCRDNREVFVAFSVDAGASWSHPRNVTSQAVRPHWPWVGTGPPSSLLLSEGPFAGRIVTPSYHTYYAHEDGELSHGHVMYSDDAGVSWSLSADIDGNGHLSNECQAVQLSNGTLLINARGLAFRRLQATSADGGSSFSPLQATSIPEPASGCEMSTISNPLSRHLLLTGPTVESLYRTHLALWRSPDQGASWQKALLIDPGPSGYSSMSWLPQSRSVALLYERSVTKQIIFVPDHISFAILPQQYTNV